MDSQAHLTVSRYIGSCPSWMQTYNGVNGEITIEGALCAELPATSPRVTDVCQGPNGSLLIDVSVPIKSIAGSVVRRLQDTELVSADAIVITNQDTEQFRISFACTGEIMESIHKHTFVCCASPQVGSPCEVRFYVPNRTSATLPKPHIMQIFVFQEAHADTELH